MDRQIAVQKGKSASGPDFFIVGAPKAGTTSLDRYLAAHPEVFMCKKERHQFGSDLAFGPAWRPRTWEDYHAAFAGREEKRLGESSVGYLFSTRAAEEIKEYRPDAQIIIMLRNPVEALHALHATLVYFGDEDIEHIEEALAAEPERRAGRRIPAANGPAFALRYRDIVCYSAQVKRYLEAFGRDQVHVIVYDDYRHDTASAYRATLEFLGVDPNFEPVFEIVNANRRARVQALRTTHAKAYLPLSRTWKTARHVARIALPSHQARMRLYRWLMRGNTVHEPREPLPTELRQRLEAQFADDVGQLGELVGRDLRHWVGRPVRDPPRSTSLPSPESPTEDRHLRP